MDDLDQKRADIAREVERLLANFQPGDEVVVVRNTPPDLDDATMVDRLTIQLTRHRSGT
jgi:hypothetical protein